MEEQNDIRARITPRNNQRIVNRAQPPLSFSQQRLAKNSGIEVQPINPTPNQITQSPHPSQQPVENKQPQQPLGQVQTPVLPIAPALPQQPAPKPSTGPPAPTDQHTTDIVSPLFTPAKPYSTLDVSAEAVPKPKPKLPIGIYLIAGIMLIGFIASFFNTTQSNTIYSVAMFIYLILAVGLIVRQNLARIAMMALSAIVIVFALVNIVMLVSLQQSIKQNIADYETAVSKIDKETLSDKDKKNLGTLQTEISNQQKKAGKQVGITYAIQVFIIIEGAVVIVYLSRPKVKSVFKAQ